MNQPAIELERRLAMYTQNSEHFRGLNSQMWQIPIIGMTLTGGLWFGVSNVKDSPIFQLGLLLLATAGNIALILVLFRLRFVMGAYLKWLDDNEPAGKINADGKRFYEKSFFVRTVFQWVLGLAATISLILFVAIAVNWKTDKSNAESREVPLIIRFHAGNVWDAGERDSKSPALQSTGNGGIEPVPSSVLKSGSPEVGRRMAKQRTPEALPHKRESVAFT